MQLRSTLNSALGPLYTPLRFLSRFHRLRSLKGLKNCTVECPEDALIGCFNCRCPHFIEEERELAHLQREIRADMQVSMCMRLS